MSDLVKRSDVIQILEQAKPWGNSADDWAASLLDDAAKKIGALPPVDKLDYSPEKPTAPGFYWYRDLRGREEVLECGFRNGELVVFLGEADCLYQQFMDGEFAGPISPPPRESMGAVKQRIEIAKKHGYCLGAAEAACRSEKQVEEYINQLNIPRYTFDLNAMHEAEKVIKGTHMWGEYKRQLSIICCTGGEFPVDASASQRSEAFVKTIGKWGLRIGQDAK